MTVPATEIWYGGLCFKRIDCEHRDGSKYYRWEAGLDGCLGVFFENVDKEPDVHAYGYYTDGSLMRTGCKTAKRAALGAVRVARTRVLRAAKLMDAIEREGGALFACETLTDAIEDLR